MKLNRKTKFDLSFFLIMTPVLAVIYLSFMVMLGGAGVDVSFILRIAGGGFFVGIVVSILYLIFNRKHLSQESEAKEGIKIFSAQSVGDVKKLRYRINYLSVSILIGFILILLMGGNYTDGFGPGIVMIFVFPTIVGLVTVVSRVSSESQIPKISKKEIFGIMVVILILILLYNINIKIKYG